MSLMTWYFKKRLETWGYGDCEIYYSLNSCQGDGVAWYGTLDEDNIRRLAARHLGGAQIAAINRVLDKGGLRLEIRCNDHHYSHYNTMSVDCELDEREMTTMEIATVDELFDAIKEDVVDCSRQLERDGYKIVFASPLDAEMIRRYQRDTVCVEIWKHPVDERYDMDGYLEPEDLYLFVRSLIRGEGEFYDLEVRIEDDNREYEPEWFGTASDVKDGRYWLTLAREMVHDARHCVERSVALAQDEARQAA